MRNVIVYECVIDKRKDIYKTLTLYSVIMVYRV